MHLTLDEAANRFAATWGRYCATTLDDRTWLGWSLNWRFDEVVVSEEARRTAEQNARDHLRSVVAAARRHPAHRLDVTYALELGRWILAGRVMEPYRAAQSDAARKLAAGHRIVAEAETGFFIVGMVAPWWGAALAAAAHSAADTYGTTRDGSRTVATTMISVGGSLVTVPLSFASRKVDGAAKIFVKAHEVFVSGFTGGAEAFIRVGDSREAFRAAILDGIAAMHPAAKTAIHTAKQHVRLREHATVPVRPKSDPHGGNGIERLLAHEADFSFPVRNRAAQARWIASTLQLQRLRPVGRAATDPPFDKPTAWNDVQGAARNVLNQLAMAEL